MVSNTPIPLIGSNAHTHTTFCDGHDSARTMLDAAINKGFFALGFSSHSYLDQEDWTMTRQGTLDYIARIRQLKEDENGRIRVYLGTELDAMSDVDLTPYDYLVASVHNIYADPAAVSAPCGKPVLSNGKVRISYDASPGSLSYIVTNLYHGDWLSLSRDYYLAVRDHIEKTTRAFTKGPVILGHFNLITKFNYTLGLIDESDPAYQKIASQVLLDCAEMGAIPEINTGGMWPGRNKEPYLNQWMLRLLKSHGYPVIIDSDCHRAGDIDHGFCEAVDAARQAGYTSVMALGKDNILEEIGL